MTLLSLFATVLFGFVLLALWVASQAGDAVGLWVGLFTSFCFVSVSLFIALQIMSRFKRG
jgi:hypothetical protein